MNLIKRQLKPILFVGGILLSNMLLWYLYLSNAYIALEPMLTAIMGSSLLMGFMIVFVLSTRNKVVVKVFGDLGNLYTWHRIIAITTTLLIFVHGLFATAKGVMNIPDVFLLGNALNAGETARNIFIGLVLLALCAKLFQYEHFRYLHRLLIFPYIFALYHGFYTSIVDLFSFSYLSIWMWFTLVLGIGSYIYMVMIYQRTSFKHHGQLIEKVILNDAIYELKIKMNKFYPIEPGQYAFIKIYKKGLKKNLILFLFQRLMVRMFISQSKL
ncbi:ferric reductase-like transmembrane domain-containing protein [Candidatus Izemoplasma sp. B36]|uniref:ferric reductase-like transmembrane domain-containing protein n=1 Tax=Candidatus Izemoplasma sp. B36 TaxID=3242468 RepID=UPI0035572938